MTPMLATLEVLFTLATVALCIFDQKWYWFAILAVMVALDVYNMILKRKLEQKQAAQSQAALMEEYRQRQAAAAAAAPAPASVPAAVPAASPAQERPKDPALAGLPEQLGQAIPIALYSDVVYKVQPGHPADLHREAELRLDDGRVIMLQHGHQVGTLEDDAAANEVADWLRAGDPVFALVDNVPFRGSAGRLRLGLYRDELSRLRKHKGAFSARLGAPEAWITAQDVGARLSVVFDEDRQRYRLAAGIREAGFLPDSAIKRLRAHDKEPEDAVCYLAGVSTDDLGKLDVEILVV